MAEALAKQRLKGLVEARSAGLNPQPQRDSLNAIRTLEDQFGIVVTGHRPGNVRDAGVESFDYVVAMDAAIGAALARITRRPIITWNVADPWGGDQAEYCECARQISHQLSSLLTQLAAS